MLCLIENFLFLSKFEIIMDTKDILLIVFPFISGVISACITYFFTLRAKKNENILKFKEEKYANLLINFVYNLCL